MTFKTFKEAEKYLESVMDIKKLNKEITRLGFSYEGLTIYEKIYLVCNPSEIKKKLYTAES